MVGLKSFTLHLSYLSIDSQSFPSFLSFLGNFFIVDRLKELIKYRGFQVPFRFCFLLFSPNHSLSLRQTVSDQSDLSRLPRLSLKPSF